MTAGVKSIVFLSRDKVMRAVNATEMSKALIEKAAKASSTETIRWRSICRTYGCPVPPTSKIVS